MANKIRVPLPVSVSSTDLLNAGMYDAGALLRIQWSATETGTYVDVSGTGSTPTITILAGTEVYTAYDGLGDSGRWYRARIENVAGTRVSDWSAVKPTSYS